MTLFLPPLSHPPHPFSFPPLPLPPPPLPLPPPYSIRSSTNKAEAQYTAITDYPTQTHFNVDSLEIEEVLSPDTPIQLIYDHSAFSLIFIIK